MTETGRTVGATVAIDAGQTGIKVRVLREDSAAVDVTLPGIRTDEPLLPQLAHAARCAVAAGSDTIAVVAAGVSGLTTRESDPGALLHLTRDLGTSRALLAHDSVTSFLGTLGDRPGAVVASGTGSVTLAVGRHSVARVDGWGNIMGDAGSAYWIGRRALEAVMRAHDGRGEATALTRIVSNRWPDVEAAYIDLQADPDRVTVVASFAESVSRLAESDTIAAAICREAAEHLAESVVTSLRLVGESDGSHSGPAVSVLGGVFASASILDRFREAVRRAHRGVEFVDARGSGLDGVALLPTISADHPLQTLVSATY